MVENDHKNGHETIKEKSASLKSALKMKAFNNGAQVYNSCFEEKGKVGKASLMNDYRRCISLLLIVFFLLTFIVSSLTFWLIAFTNKFNENIVENLILKNETKTMTWWIESPIQPLLKVYIFNYSNIEEFKNNPQENKLKLNEVGPFVFKQFSKKKNLVYHEDHKITFQDDIRLDYMMDESFKRSLNDTVVVPNVPLMAALKIASNLSFIESSGFDTILGISKPIEFQPKTVNEFLFGYSDQFIQLTPKIEPEKVGLLSGRNGISQDNMTIYTGEDTLDNLGRIDSMNGKPRLDIWNNEECNEIDGTDGSQFPPHLMDTSKDLKIFIRSFCRSLALRYEREVSVLNGIPAWRYKAPKGQFDSSRKNPDMKCYCDWEKENCLPDGIFDASKCNDGIPLLVSYPHFMEGDESLFKHFEGLKPDEKKHETFADIHPRMAFPIGGASRLQINMKVTNRKFGLLWDRKTLFKNFPENMILPIMWFEVTSGEIPPEFQSIVFHTTQSANATYIALKYGSLIGALVSIILLSLSAHWFACIKKDESDGQNGAEIVVIYNSNICPQLSSSIQS